MNKFNKGRVEMKQGKANAIHRLPKELLQEVQKYVQGETIYIPKPKAARIKWGERSGGRKLIDHRNAQIRTLFQNGLTIEQLAERYHLSLDSIRKIVYGSKRK